MADVIQLRDYRRTGSSNPWFGPLDRAKAIQRAAIYGEAADRHGRAAALARGSEAVALSFFAAHYARQAKAYTDLARRAA